MAFNTGVMQVRARVVEVKRRLEQGLNVLSAAALGDPAWALGQIDYLESLVQPLLDSPLVGEGAAFQVQMLPHHPLVHYLAAVSVMGVELIVEAA